MAEEVETEILAIDHCIKALAVLPDDGVQRALRYLNDRFAKKYPPLSPPQQWITGTVQTH